MRERLACVAGFALDPDNWARLRSQVRGTMVGPRLFLLILREYVTCQKPGTCFAKLGARPLCGLGARRNLANGSTHDSGSARRNASPPRGARQGAQDPRQVDLP